MISLRDVLDMDCLAQAGFLFDLIQDFKVRGDRLKPFYLNQMSRKEG